ncbi:MAG TPA: glycosyltransferase family 4 protein [Terracidiphilus sp.]|jgi:glycosyltransferase involved in cell wall biosynthesis|nr:glycosyltransferase family 4 protein [Terracidiphilus sp.]
MYQPKASSTDGSQKLKAAVLYQFFPPDEIVSAVLFGELASELAKQGWEVDAYPSNRDCRSEALRYLATENLDGVRIQRLWRPSLAQSTGAGRILNALWMIARWSLIGCDPRVRPDVLIIGTDPILSVLTTWVWRRLKPRVKIVHWCFDLYPEAAIADGILKADGRIVAFLRILLSKAYAACDLIVDIGPRMRMLLTRYTRDTPVDTLVPWALHESSQVTPVNTSERHALFGESRLALMYSGTLGRAHSFEHILEIARRLRAHDIKITFSVSGHQVPALRRSILPEDANVMVIAPVAASEISKRLSAADIHIVTLREEWSGIVVPSKFFGALSLGRPVLFCGSPDSDIARWINEYRVGWVLTPETAERVASELVGLISSRKKLEEMFLHCHQIYTEYFSKAVTMARWDNDLRKLFFPSRCDERAFEKNGLDS